MSTIEVNTIDSVSGTSNLTIGSSNSSQITLKSGATLTNFPANTPAFRAGLSSAQTISNGSHTAIVFDTEQFDSDSAYDNSNGRFTVPSNKAGKYFFYAHFRYQEASKFDTAIEIHKNGSQVVHIEFGDNGNYPSCQASYICDLSVGDYIQATAYQLSGSSKDLTGNINYTAFGGFKLT
jgi:hypothetical protein